LRTDAIDVVFNNNNRYSIKTEDNSVVDSLCLMLKHLSRVPLRFGVFDNPYTISRQLVADQIVQLSNALVLPMEQARLSDQQYLNHLHTYFEHRTNDGNEWHMYNEAIHLLEVFNRGAEKEKKLTLDYGSKAGPLSRAYRYREFDSMQMQFAPGDCFVDFGELGKTPYHYWRDCESDDVVRLCELAKPMLRLNFKIVVALDHIDLTPVDTAQFEQWFSQYREQWCQHWQVPHWSVTQMQGGILVGKMNDVTGFIRDMQAGAAPNRLCI